MVCSTQQSTTVSNDIWLIWTHMYILLYLEVSIPKPKGCTNTHGLCTMDGVVKNLLNCHTKCQFMDCAIWLATQYFIRHYAMFSVLDVRICSYRSMNGINNISRSSGYNEVLLAPNFHMSNNQFIVQDIKQRRWNVLSSLSKPQGLK